MGTANISYLSIFSLIVFIAVIFIVNNKLRLSLNKEISIAIIRMVIQLSLVGLFLQYLFKLNMPIINMLYLFFMMIIASFSAIKSNKNIVKNYWMQIFLSILIPNLVILLYFNTFVIRLDNILDAWYVIPIGGMLLGNALTGIIITMNSYIKSLEEKHLKYYYLLSLSANHKEAIKPYIKEALLTSIKPSIASIETIGLVALPGMMTGQILGGSVPLTAIKYQIAIMLAIFSVRYFCSLLIIVFISGKLFDDYGIIKI
ncbi:ABC transporter permease [Helicovermis profundi]|uniref:ABC transporter permease n=1 Tax=Helicovermis profundi TaxID=3065157 RepID=A0AAU9EBM9_9FIRM|nr:ABC transporter permease [Clostridia bacterium S502]